MRAVMWKDTLEKEDQYAVPRFIESLSVYTARVRAGRRHGCGRGGGRDGRGVGGGREVRAGASVACGGRNACVRIVRYAGEDGVERGWWDDGGVVAMRVCARGDVDHMPRAYINFTRIARVGRIFVCGGGGAYDTEAV